MMFPKNNPIVFHFPGLKINPNKYKHWNYLKEICINSNKKLEPDDDLTIITWNSSKEEGILEKKLNISNIPFITIGKNNINWKNKNKIKFTIEILESIKTKYVLAMDCYDVLIFDSPKKILKKFLKLNCDMLLNCEKNFWPDCGYGATEDWKNFERKLTNSNFCYLNSGVWIAKKEYCKKFLEMCLIGIEDLIELNLMPKKLWHSYAGDSDQVVMHRVWFDNFKNLNKLKLDYNNFIFFNAANSEEFLDIDFLSKC